MYSANRKLTRENANFVSLQIKCAIVLQVGKILDTPRFSKASLRSNLPTYPEL